MLVAASHLVVGLIGAVLLYVALFLRETEEGKLQNRLEKLWVDIDDLSKAALDRQSAFLQQVSTLANSGLDALFGRRLFSARAISTSLSFTTGSLLLFAAYTVVYIQRPTVMGFSFAYLGLPLLMVGIFSFFVGFLPAPFRYLGFLWIPGWIFLFLYLDRDTAQWSWKWWAEEFGPLLVMLVGSFFSDVLFIAMSRWFLRKSSKLRNGWKIISLLTLNGCVGFALISPALWGIVALAKEEFPEGDVYPILAAIGGSNLASGVISVLYLLLALAALMHLVVWPILERPIYSLQRFGVARNPKLLAATSAICLVSAWPNSPIIQAITKLIHG